MVNKNKKAFTLVELLAVVIILALTFMFVAPKMASLIKEGNNNEVRLIEQKALVSAKNYINNYDTNFLNNFIEVGHTKTVYKQDLIDNGLMTLEEIEQIEDFRGVQVKLLENDKLEYTISRLSSTKDYTNEELYQLIDALQNNINSLSTQVNNNNSNSNIFLKSYPVGSIYISTSSTNPGSTYGGTWVEYGKGKTLVGVDSSDSDFNTVEKIGGSKYLQEHYHDIRYSSADGRGVTISTNGEGVETLDITSWAWTKHGLNEKGSGAGLFTNKEGSGNSGNLQPYITVYMWKRTA